MSELPETLDEWRDHYIPQGLEVIEAVVNHSNKVGNQRLGAVAAKVHLERARHEDLLRKIAESGKHHWSATPGFWVAVGGFLLAGLAAWFAWQSIPHPTPQDAGSQPSSSPTPPPTVSPTPP